MVSEMIDHDREEACKELIEGKGFQIVGPREGGNMAMRLIQPSDRFFAGKRGKVGSAIAGFLQRSGMAIH